MSIVYLNGDFIDESEAKISVFDRGFLFADSIYDAINVYKQHFVDVDKHLQRLEESLQAIGMDMPFPPEKFKNIFTKLVACNAYTEDELSIYVQVTRGIQVPRSYLVKEPLTPTVFISCSPVSKKPDSLLRKGLTAITLTDKRKQDCYIKSTSLLPSVIAANQAKQAGVDEALLVYQGEVLESSSGNLFIVKNNQIITPPLQPHILAGVTRDTILQIAKDQRFKTRETAISLDDLMRAEEVWVTGSIKGICPVVRINGQAIGGGCAGHVWQQLYRCYQDYKENLALKEAKE